MRIKRTAKGVRNKHLGSSFEDFLNEQGALKEMTALAIKRVRAWLRAKASRRSLPR